MSEPAPDPYAGEDEPSMAERYGISEQDLAESDAWWETHDPAEGPS